MGWLGWQCRCTFGFEDGLVVEGHSGNGKWERETGSGWDCAVKRGLAGWDEGQADNYADVESEVKVA